MAQEVLERMTDRVGEVLEEGERFFGAQPLTIKGRNALKAWAAEGDIMSALPNYVRQHGDIDGIDVADASIPNAFLAAVTDRRVLVFSRSLTGKAKELIDTHELAATTLDVVDTGDKARSRMFIFGTLSGKVFAGECGINGKALETADAFVQGWIEAEGLSQN